MCYFICYPKDSFGYLFYRPTKNKIFVARTTVFRERDLTSQETSGSSIDIYDIKEPTSNEPKVDTRPQKEVKQSIEEPNVLPPHLVDLIENVIHQNFMDSILLKRMIAY